METLTKRLNNSIEYRNLTLTIAEDEGEENAYIAEGYATTFDEPYTLYTDGEYRIDEVVDPHAFDECDMTDVIMQYDHEGRVYARTRNSTLQITPDEHGLYVRADLSGTESGRQLWEEIHGGYIDRMSFGFVVSGADTEDRKENGQTIVTRRITGIRKLYDVSAVSIPANDGTDISARKFGDGVIAELETERRKLIARQQLELRLKLLEV